MKGQMNKIKERIAENYLSDARDFISRFDYLWEREQHKTGRIKSFTDLLMAFECILKCHAVLSHTSNNPEKVYRSVRRCGHDISRLGPIGPSFGCPPFSNHTDIDL